MNTKAIFFDIDGTLIDFGMDVMSDSTTNALKRAQSNGHKIFLCTGRCKKQISEYLLNFGFDGIICSAGAYVECKGKTIHQRCISIPALEKMVSYFQKNYITYILMGTTRLLATKDNRLKICKRFGEDLGISWEEAARRFDILELEDDVLQNIQKYSDIETGMFIQSKVSPEEVKKFLKPEIHITASSYGGRKDEGSGEFTQNGITKATGMQDMLRYLNIQKKDSIAFGDGPNDLDMLAFADTGIAMGNALEYVKSCSDMVTDSIKNNGIYKAMSLLNLL